jgi:hypothetical protein
VQDPNIKVLELGKPNEGRSDGRWRSGSHAAVQVPSVDL